MWLAKSEEVCFVVDEAQTIYNLGAAHPFWRAVKALSTEPPCSSAASASCYWPLTA